MLTREAPDFWGLHKNMNCAFPRNYIIINQRKLLTIFRRVLFEIQANQSNFFTFEN